jgi:hypothetical protein
MLKRSAIARALGFGSTPRAASGLGLVESKIYGLWIAKQAKRGEAAAAAIKRLRQVTGNVKVDRSDGREKFGTDSRFGSAQHFVDSIMGSGDPGIQAQPGPLAYLLYLFAGQETVEVGAGEEAGVETHIITPAAAGGFWATVWKKVGVSDVVREKSADCKIGQVVIEGSTGQKVVRVTPTIASLDPGEKVAADPVKAFDGDDAFLYTEGESAFEINEEVIRAQSQFQITINEALEPVMTDSVVPLELAAGEPEVTVALTLALNTDGLAIYNREVYGSAEPAPGTKPLKTLPAIGAYEFLLEKSKELSFGLELPGVKWTPDVAVEPNPAGGLTEVSLAGEFQEVAGQPAWRATVKNADVAYA